MNISSSNLITAVLVVSILCLCMLAYTIIGSSNITLGGVKNLTNTEPKPSPRIAAIVSNSHYGTEKILLSDRAGHYWLDAEVDRASIRFMIDTGASMTVLSYDDASRVGVRVDQLTFDRPVMTGSGSASFASASLPYIEADHLRVDGIKALVAPKGGMQQSVLGADFLARLDSYSVASGKMTLVP